MVKELYCFALIQTLFSSQDLKNQKYVKLSIVHCPPVTMAIIKRPDPKFQLGFSVEDGIVCRIVCYKRFGNTICMIEEWLNTDNVFHRPKLLFKYKIPKCVFVNQYNFTT